MPSLQNVAHVPGKGEDGSASEALAAALPGTQAAVLHGLGVPADFELALASQRTNKTKN